MSSTFTQRTYTSPAIIPRRALILSTVFGACHKLLAYLLNMWGRCMRASRCSRCRLLLV